MRFVVLKHNIYWGFFEQSVFYYPFYVKKFVGVVSAHFCSTLWNIDSIINYRRRHNKAIVVLTIPSSNSKMNIKDIVSEKIWENTVI